MTDRREWEAMEESMGRALKDVRKRQLSFDALIAVASFEAAAWLPVWK
jgi:hypothetical protein